MYNITHAHFKCLDVLASFSLLLKIQKEKIAAYLFSPSTIQLFFFIQALHPLLEDGCPDDKEYEDYKKVYN